LGGLLEDRRDGDSWLRQPFLWIVKTGLVFPYLHTLEERKAMSSTKLKGFE
jgi:hypothetical protein